MSASRVARVRALLPAIAAAGFTIALGAQTPPTPPPAPPQQPTFRASTDVVAVDVRVLDRKGQPVTDLKSSDFTLYENNVKQDITQFAAQALTPSAPDSDLQMRRTGVVTTIKPQNRRLFLILLARGRLQGPTKGIDALLTFVREKLMPQDLVAVMAWNRATDFTADHELVASLLDRFRPRHEAIETELGLLYSGLSGLYAGGRPIPRNIQKMIDDVFDLPGATTRQVIPGTATQNAEAAAKDQNELLLRKSVIEARNADYRKFNTTDLALGDLMSDTTLGSNFDDYVALSRQTLQDVGNMYAAIDYMRFLEGEKHLLLVTEQGFFLPSANDDRDLAAMASDARVVIDTFQTGGVATQMVGGFPVVSPTNGFALGALREVSNRTGGQVFVSGHGIDAVNAIANATEFDYVLGYASSTPNLDSKYRNIKVEVARKNVTLAYRRGYFARPAESFDPRKAIATTRMIGAANTRADIPDLRLNVKVTDVKEGNARSVTVDTIIQADHIGFARTPTGYFVALTVAVLLSDVHGDTSGEQWRTVNLDITNDQYADVKVNGLKLRTSVPIKSPPAWVKVIVYDYGSDLLGSSSVRRY